MWTTGKRRCRWARTPSAEKPVERRWLLDRLHALTGRKAPRKVLLIDDEEVSRYLLRQLFPPQMGQVIEAANGAEGLRFARDEQPQSDPARSADAGDRAASKCWNRLRADPRTAEIPVVVSTSKVLDAAERARLERNAAGFLPKSALSDGTAAAELRRICAGIGLADLWPEVARARLMTRTPPTHPGRRR